MGVEYGQRREIVSGISLGIVETRRRLSTMRDQTRAMNAVWVYNRLVCIRHLQHGPWFVGALAGVAFLLLAGSIVIFLLGPVDVIKAVVCIVVAFAVSFWACKFLAQELWYRPKINHCVTQLRSQSSTTFLVALTDIGQYDPDIVHMWRRLWGRPKFPPG